MDGYGREQGEGGASSAAGRVEDALRRSILALDLPPDTTLSRAALARAHGVSQTPVREALQRLEQEGLVDIFPQSRTVVSRIDLPRLGEAHFLRVAVESEAARRLALSRPAPALERARGLVRMQGALAGDLSQIGPFTDLDEAFHRCLLEGVGQGGLVAVLRAHSGQMARLRRLDLPREEKMRGIVQAHRAILAAIESGDAQAAVAAMQAHLSGTIARIETLRAAHPDYFSAAGAAAPISAISAGVR